MTSQPNGTPDLPTPESGREAFARLDKDALKDDMLEYVMTVGAWAEKIRVKHNMSPRMLHEVMARAPGPALAHQLYLAKCSEIMEDIRRTAGEN